MASKEPGRVSASSTALQPLPAPLHPPAAGVENAYYEGPLRVRLPVNMQLDADGAFSFEAPLPSPEGALGQVRQCMALQLAWRRPDCAAVWMC